MFGSFTFMKTGRKPKKRQVLRPRQATAAKQIGWKQTRNPVCSPPPSIEIVSDPKFTRRYALVRSIPADDTKVTESSSPKPAHKEHDRNVSGSIH
jgi:hypothetical protein